jgi:histidine triad (HIT) family protein
VTPRGDEHDDLVCQIVRGTAEADVVLRTDDVVAFLDIHPVFKGHVLVSPVRHVDTLLELAADQMVPLLTAAPGPSRPRSGRRARSSP